MLFAVAVLAIALAPSVSRADNGPSWGGGGWGWGWGWGWTWGWTWGGQDGDDGHHDGHHTSGGHGGAPLPLLAAGLPGVLALAGGAVAYRRRARQ